MHYRCKSKAGTKRRDKMENNKSVNVVKEERVFGNSFSESLTSEILEIQREVGLTISEEKISYRADYYRNLDKKLRHMQKISSDNKKNLEAALRLKIEKLYVWKGIVDSLKQKKERFILDNETYSEITKEELDEIEKGIGIK